MTEPDAGPVRYEVPRPRVARLVLQRVSARNAQDTNLLYALNDAFDRAVADPDIRVIILAADGPHFSAGHDMYELDHAAAMANHRAVGAWGSYSGDGAEPRAAREKEIYSGLSERWRNISKPTVAEVQGKVVAGGLMLVWPCDIVIAASNAEFSDNTLDMGVSGVEYFAHPYELGARAAKEMLFTSEVVSAQEAHRLGMVNHVVDAELLTSFTLDLAEKIAKKPMLALKAAKEAVNGFQDAAGRASAQQTAFWLHQLCHSHNQQLFGTAVDPSFWGVTTLSKPGDGSR